MAGREKRILHSDHPINSFHPNESTAQGLLEGELLHKEFVRMQ